MTGTGLDDADRRWACRRDPAVPCAGRRALSGHDEDALRVRAALPGHARQRRRVQPTLGRTAVQSLHHRAARCIGCARQLPVDIRQLIGLASGLRRADDIDYFHGRSRADQVAGGGAAAVVKETGRHAGRLTGGAPGPSRVETPVGSVSRRGRCVGGRDTRWRRPAWLADAPPWRCGRLSGAGSRMWYGGGVARRGPPVGLAVRGSRPPGLRAAACPPRLARGPARRALTRWCAARGGEAVWCAGRRCRLGGAACHAASPVRAAPDRRPAGRRPRAVPVR